MSSKPQSVLDSKRIMICAGEASGDLHAAKLITKLKQLVPNIDIEGMGGPQLQAAGADILVDCRDIAVMGIVEVIKRWRPIRRAFARLRQRLITNPPDLLILVDYVEFNLRLAAIAKPRGIKVLFYVSPQVWAWRAGRIPKIGKVIDMMAVLFPFETQYYQAYNIPVRYVGHPLSDTVQSTADRNHIRQQYNLHLNAPTVALLPGSRRSEIARILPVMLASAKLIQKTLTSVQFVLPLAPTLDIQTLQLDNVQEKHGLNLHIIENDTYNIVYSADAAIVASGTATLETALLGIPMSVVYRIHWLSYAIMRHLVQIKLFSLVNIVAGKQIVPEFIQKQAEPHMIAKETLRQLSDKDYAESIKNELKHVKELLGSGGGSLKVAKLATEMLSNTNQAVTESLRN